MRIHNQFWDVPNLRGRLHEEEAIFRLAYKFKIYPLHQLY